MPRSLLTMRQKKKLIEQSENQTVEDLAMTFSINQRTVFRCMENKDAIFQMSSSNGNSKRAYGRFNEEHDQVVIDFISMAQEAGLPLSGLAVRNKAKELAQQMGLELQCSNGWWSRFCKRRKVKLGKLSGESAEVSDEDVEKFRRQNIPSILSGSSDAFIYNCDETALFFRALPTKTFFVPLKQHFGTKLSKERLTVLFCVNKQGESEKPFIIGKSANPRCFKKERNISSLKENYASNQTAWMTRIVFEKWLTMWHKQLALDSKRVVLLLDNFSGHNVNFAEFPLIRFHFLPPNTTSRLQPLDGGIIKSFKSHYTSLLMSRLLALFEQNKQQQTKSSVTDLTKSITVLDAIQWTNSGWGEVSEQTIKNCWLRCGFGRNEVDLSLLQPMSETSADVVRLYKEVTDVIPNSLPLSEYLELLEAGPRNDYIDQSEHTASNFKSSNCNNLPSHLRFHDYCKEYKFLIH